MNEEQNNSSLETKAKIFKFLDANSTGVLSTITPKGLPHGAVIYYWVDANLDILFMTKRDTTKSNNLQKNNHANLIVYDALNQTTVQVSGKVHDISNGNDAKLAFDNLLHSSQKAGQPVPPVSKLFAGYYAAYRLHPNEIKMAVYSEAAEGKDFKFEVINDF